VRRGALLVGAALAALLASPGASPAQAPISTDRPGLGFNPATVAAGRVQVELGLPRIDQAGTADDPAVGVDAALRWGLAPRLEARLSTTWYGRTPGDGLTDGPTGIAGLRAGAHVQVIATPRVNVAVIPEVVLPIGSEALAGDRAAWSVNGAAGFGVGSASLVLVGGAQWNPAGEDDHQATGLLVAVLGHGLSSTVSGYAEAGILPTAGADPAYAGGGIAWLANPRTQLDVFVDLGLNDAASNAVFGVGISFLLHEETPRHDNAVLDRPAGRDGPVRLPAGGLAQAGAVLK
jgi:hypothetical protein